MSTQRYTATQAADHIVRDIQHVKESTRQKKYCMALNPGVPEQYREKVASLVFNQTGADINWEEHARGEIIIVRL